VVLHHGDRVTAETICRSTGGTFSSSKPSAFEPTVGICGGAISWLQLTAAQEREVIAPAILQWKLSKLFLLLAVPTFAPLVALMYVFDRRDGLRFEVRVVLCCALISLTGMGFLCYMGVDWGRWFHMQVICLMLLAMMMDRKRNANTATVLSARQRSFGFRMAAIVALFLYATAWTLPGIGNFGESPGYFAIIWPVYRSGLHTLRLHAVKEVRKVI
jgi:hypothetical protein